MTFPDDLYERAGRSTCDCPGWEGDAYGCPDCQDLAANVLNMAAPHVAAWEAQAWDDGFDVGHQAARNPEWPGASNPHRSQLADR